MFQAESAWSKKIQNSHKPRHQARPVHWLLHHPFFSLSTNLHALYLRVVTLIPRCLSLVVPDLRSLQLLQPFPPLWRKYFLRFWVASSSLYPQTQVYLLPSPNQSERISSLHLRQPLSNVAALHSKNVCSPLCLQHLLLQFSFVLFLS